VIEPVEIMNRFTEYSPSKGEEPLPLPIPGHWFRKICALAERIARAENERDVLRARITELEADRDSEARWAKAYLARAEKAEKEAERLRDAAIITDTNGMRCLFCEGQDDDYEGVVHKDDCPLKDGPKCQP
jgi:hypothetical protein